MIKILVLLCTAFPLLLTLYAGTRLVVILYLFAIMIVIKPDVSNLKNRIRLLLLFMFMIPFLAIFFSYWGEARSYAVGEGSGLLSNVSLAALIPIELFSGYIAGTRWHVSDEYKVIEFLSQFFPNSLLNILGVDKVSLSSEMNRAIRGNLVEVYVVSLGAWASYPLPSYVGTLVTLFMLFFCIYLFFELLRYFIFDDRVYIVVYALLALQLWNLIRIDPAQWFSSAYQSLIWINAIVFVAYYLSKVRVGR
jgi:hypothetical protein